MSWQRVRGHDVLIRAFQRVIRRGRLAHAYLFTGPAGVGKRLFATELAKTLLCEQPPESLDACDVCPSCVQIDVETHPDFFAVKRPEEALEFPIGVMRDLVQRFALKSARGRGKVILVDDADDLNEESANCFLKTLEEPPPRSVIILIGTSPERQLPTILSRCQIVNFAPLSCELVHSLLADSVTDGAMLERLVLLSEGSPGTARALSDPALWEFRKTLVQGISGGKLDSVAMGTTWWDFVKEAGAEAAAQRQRASLCLGLLLALFQDAVRLSLGMSPRLSDPEDRATLQALAAKLDVEPLLGLMERCLESDYQIDRRVQLQLIVEALMDTLGQRMT